MPYNSCITSRVGSFRLLANPNHHLDSCTRRAVRADFRYCRQFRRLHPRTCPYLASTKVSAQNDASHETLPKRAFSATHLLLL